MISLCSKKECILNLKPQPIHIMNLKFIPACSTEFTHEIDDIIFTAGQDSSWYYDDNVGNGDYIINLDRLRDYEDSEEESMEKPAKEITAILDSQPTLNGWRSLTLLFVKGS